MPDNRKPPLSPTELLLAWGRGDQDAFDELVPLVYDELRRLAQGHIARERADHTLQASGLVHEAYVRLIELKQMRWQNRAHFFAMAARVMCLILVDNGRARRNKKRGGGVPNETLEEALVVASGPGADLVALDEALTALEGLHPRKSQVVELRYFAGLSLEETAEPLGVSIRYGQACWRFAKLWLFSELSGKTPK